MMTRKVISVILGLLMIIAGVYCFFTPVETSAVIPFVLGIVMISAKEYKKPADEAERFA